MPPPHLGFPATWKAIQSGICPSVEAEIVCNPSVSPHIPRNTCQTQPGPEWSYLSTDAAPKYLSWWGRTLIGDWQSLGKFGAKSHTLSTARNSIMCDIYPTNPCFYVPWAAPLTSCDPTLEPVFTPATFYHFPTAKRVDTEVSAWSWTASCPTASPGGVCSSSWQYCPALLIRRENAEQAVHFIKLLIAQALLPGTSSGGSQLPLSAASRAGAN